MKLLIIALVLAVAAYACQNKFTHAQPVSEKDAVSTQGSFITKSNTPIKGSINAKTEEVTKGEKMILNNGRKQSQVRHIFPAEDFLFVSLILVN